MTSYLKRFPPALLDSVVVGCLVAMVTLPWHSGRPPERTEMVGKGGVSPLVLFAGVTGHRQEAAHRELRLRLCGVTTEGRHRVMPRAGGQNVHIRQRCSLNGTLSANKHLCAPVPLHPPTPWQPSPTWGLCSNERPHCSFISFSGVCSVLAESYSSPTQCCHCLYRCYHTHKGTEEQCLSYTVRENTAYLDQHVTFSNILGSLPQASHSIYVGFGSFLQSDGSRQESDMSLQYADFVVL